MSEKRMSSNMKFRACHFIDRVSTLFFNAFYEFLYHFWVKFHNKLTNSPSNDCFCHEDIIG